jgi:Immunity protein 26
MKRIKFSEGTWFGVPLSSGKFAVGLVARKSRGGQILLGYFFGPPRSTLPKIDELEKFKKNDSVYCKRFGYLGLREGEWPIIGTAEEWNRHDWPMPIFYIDPLLIPGKIYKVFHSDEDPSVELSRVLIEKPSREMLSGGLAGSKFVENMLTKILEPPSK